MTPNSNSFIMERKEKKTHQNLDHLTARMEKMILQHNKEVKF